MLSHCRWVKALPHGQGRMVPTQCHKITFSELTFRFQVHIWDRKSCETSPAPLSTGMLSLISVSISLRIYNVTLKYY